MRAIWIIPFLFLANCANLAERALSGQTASEKLRFELGADIDLRLALNNDTAKKRAQLEFISDGGFTCGEPITAYREFPIYNPAGYTAEGLTERKRRRTAFLRAKYSELDIVIAYGDALAATIKDEAARQISFALFQKVVDTYAGFVPTEFKFAPGLLKSAAGLGQLVDKYAFKIQIIGIAAKYQEALENARKQIIAKGILKALTETEDRAFKIWDDCARVRLLFMREYDPLNPSADFVKRNVDRIVNNTRGEARSPVLDFVSEFNRYIQEREAFVGMRPDYTAAIDAIINSNKKLANLSADASPDDFFNTLIQLGGDSSAALENYQSLRENLRVMQGS